MNLTAQLEGVLDVLRRMEVEVRHARLGGEGGGLCVIKGKQVVFVDIDADAATRLDRCLTALMQLAGLESVFVPPQIRDLIEKRRMEDGSAPP